MKSNGHSAIDAWRAGLLVSKHGAPKPLLANAITALRDAPQWQQAKMAYDAFYQRVIIRGQAPWSRSVEERAWTDHDDLRAADWLQHNGICVSSDTAGKAIQIAARDTLTFHPVLDYLNKCRWDGEPRLDQWVMRYLGVENSEYAQAVGARFLISAVARVNVPGCKADCALILEGEQGLLKSTALKTLFSPWFSDDIADLGSKDAAMQIAGVWCMEMSELDSIKRGDVSRIKSFLSRTTDHFRLPYGHHITDQPRQNVFAGTVNDCEYLRDDSGARRFWPLACLLIDICGLELARDQLWAEARDRYFAGESWWLDRPDLVAVATVEQNQRRIEDPWHNKIEEVTQYLESSTPAEVLLEIGIAQKDHTQLAHNRVASCLKILGWQRRSCRHHGKPTRRYFPPEPSTPSTKNLGNLPV